MARHMDEVVAWMRWGEPDGLRPVFSREECEEVAKAAQETKRIQSYRMVPTTASGDRGIVEAVLRVWVGDVK